MYVAVRSATWRVDDAAPPEEVEMTDKNVLGPLSRAPGGSLWALFAVLVVMCAIVLRPFLTPLLWAAIVAYTSWPLYR